MSLLLSLLLSLSAHALEINRGESGRIELTAPCEESAAELKSLEAWTLSSGGSCAPRALPSRNGLCVVDIHDCVPAHVRKYQDAVPETSGPSCWNLALVMKGILPALRTTSNAEAAFLFRSGLCQKVERPAPGDIGAVRRPGKPCGVSFEENCEVHGFIYVSDKLGYSKNGAERTSPYRLQPSAPFLESYGVGKGNHVDYFRCRSREAYLDSLSPPPEWKEVNASLDYVDCVVSETAFRPHVFAGSEQKQLVSAIGAVYDYVKKESEKPRRPDEKFLYDAMVLRLGSLEAQMENFRTNETGTGVAAVRRGFPLLEIYDKGGREIFPELIESLENLGPKVTAPSRE